MNSGQNCLRVEGSDLIFSVSIVDAAGDAVVADQTVDIAVQRLQDSKWWNSATEAFDLAAEPALLSAAQVGATGVYEYTMSAAYEVEKNNYRIRIDADDTVEKDFYLDNVVVEAESSLVIGAFNAIVEKEIAKIAGSNADLLKKLKLLIAGVERTKKGRL